MAELCYTGDPAAVTDLMDELADSLFSDQLGIFAFQVDGEDFLVSVDEAFILNSGWESAWNSASRAPSDLFIMYSVDDSGTPEVFTLPACF